MSDVLDLPFDQYQRYELVRALLDDVRGPGETLDVLDVGGRTALLREFLTEDRVHLVDVDPSDAKGLILGSGAQLPFADNSFDAVAAFDTLEHVPPPLRGAFVAECARVSRRYVMLAGPYDSPRVAEAEELLLDFLKRRLNWEHRYLKEHRVNGLPDMGDTVRGFEAAGARVATFGHGALDRWLALMVIELYVEHEALLREIAPRIYRLYNEHLFASDHGDDVYRHAVVAAFGDAPMPSLERALGPAGTVPPEATRAFIEAGTEFARYDALRDTYEPELERIHGVVKALEEDLAQHRASLGTVTADRDESKRTVEALGAELERERTAVAEILAEKDLEIAARGGVIDELRGVQQSQDAVIAELRAQHEAEAREIRVRGEALEAAHAEMRELHDRMHDALAHVQQRDSTVESLRGEIASALSGISDALSGTEDDAAREQLLDAQELTLADELALLIDARNRRRLERDEARDQVLALTAELLRERERGDQLEAEAFSLGARLWRALRFKRLDPELRSSGD